MIGKATGKYIALDMGRFQRIISGTITGPHLVEVQRIEKRNDDVIEDGSYGKHAITQLPGSGTIRLRKPCGMQIRKPAAPIKSACISSISITQFSMMRIMVEMLSCENILFKL